MRKEIVERVIKNRDDVAIKLEVENLLKQMTLKEKIGQMYQAPYSSTELVGPTWNNLDTESLIKEGSVGSILSLSDLDSIYKLQKIAVEESRLGIPLFFAYDIIRGYKTIFPIPLAMASSWDIDLLEESCKIIAKESANSGLHMTFSPMLDLVRDPRWGRVMESHGEDPYLGSEIGKAYIRGFQQGDFSKKDAIAACIKHFIGYGASEGGRDYSNVDISRHSLFQYYIPPFKAGVLEGVASVMTSFNVFEGIPATSNRYLLKNILREKLGFDGVIISDFTSTTEIINHKIAIDFKEVAQKCSHATLDIEMVGTSFIDELEEICDENPEYLELVDQAVARVLMLKYKMGLFDNPYKGMKEKGEKLYLLPEYREKAREMSEKSMVLLKNDSLLPLKRESKIAIIGPYADSKNVLGFWNGLGEEKDCISLLEGLKNSGFSNVEYLQIDMDQSEILNENFFPDALAMASRADVVLLALGEHQFNIGEGASRTLLEFSESQKKLAQEIKKLNKKIALLSFTGRPLILDWFHENMDAILQVWFLGSESGNAIGNILSGIKSPSGKLTMSFPLNQGQIPVYYNCLKTGRPLDKNNVHRFCSKYIDSSNEPLYPFGYGLTYGDIEYENLKLDKKQLTSDNFIEISIQIKNTGNYSVEEIVQLYIEAETFSVSRPLKELKGFKRVKLEKNTIEKVIFKLTAEDLKFHNSDLEYVNESGKYRIYVGKNSRNTLVETINFNGGKR
ncbi:MAG: glycoside hydrolase family 3 N-terminal domain-containing protein [Fusobacteriaceae bacterium]